MSLSIHKPYLIIPKLIEQPTWGGTYLLQLKKWANKPHLKDKKIGQSYELFGGSKLLLDINDSSSDEFIPEFGFADKDETVQEGFTYQYQKDYVHLSDLITQNPDEILGERIYEKYGKMPLLNKLTQSLGNSFQLHIKPGLNHPHWQPKPESWYYLEDGLVTCGIRDGVNLEEYKKTCHEINDAMKTLSNQIVSGKMKLDEAKMQAKQLIQEKNPWQFVNTHETKKYSLIDLSAGGVHHSWEENRKKFPLGNILYEVQQDVMDPVSTIRAFDQGKFKSDGTIREIQIDDYFTFMDTDPASNDIENLTRTQQGMHLLSTPHYSLDILELTDNSDDYTNNSFCHLYIREGAADIIAEDGTVHLTQGHSCFIPQSIQKYTIQTNKQKVVVLKTYIEV